MRNYFYNIIRERSWVNKVLIIVLGLLLVNLCREYIWVAPPAIDEAEEEVLLSLDFNIPKNTWDYYESIFTDEKKVLEPDQILLPLVLKGTVISNPSKSFAIIQDLETGAQDLYNLGDTVCSAKIVAMGRNRVVLEYNGRKQEIKMFEVKPRTFQLCKASPRITEPPLDFTRLLTQVRIKPYFESGRCIGFQLSSIRNGSLVERLGLREGDIIETVNGVKINDPLKALQLLYDTERSNPVHLGIERKSEKMELDCRLEG